MLAAAARETRDGDKVFVGMRLPLLGFAVAKETRGTEQELNLIIRLWRK